jgi:methionyl-tRNA formyltransferase
MPTPAHILFAGSGEFGSPTLRALVEAGHKLLHVYTQPDRPAGRGKKLTPTPIAILAEELGLPVTRTADINVEPLPIADLLVVIAFGQKIAESVVNHSRLGSVNLHSSLLPKYRGAAPINWAVINGDEITGNSIIRLANKMDAGAVVAQNQLTIGESETAGELHDRLARLGVPLMLDCVSKLQFGTAKEKQQDDSLATIAPKLSRQNTQLDWSKPARVIVRQINGLSPWPGCRVSLTESGNEVAKLTLVRSRPANTTGEPGTIQPDGTIAAGDGKSVEIIELQPEGRRPMRLIDFQNGRPWKSGMHAVSVS